MAYLNKRKKRNKEDVTTPVYKDGWLLLLGIVYPQWLGGRKKEIL